MEMSDERRAAGETMRSSRIHVARPRCTDPQQQLFQQPLSEQRLVDFAQQLCLVRVAVLLHALNSKD